jgi:hypothetical protein
MKNKKFADKFRYINLSSPSGGQGVNKRGRDRNPASYKIQYPMKNRNKDVFNN